MHRRSMGPSRGRGNLAGRWPGGGGSAAVAPFAPLCFNRPMRSTFYMVEMDYPHGTAAGRAAFDAFYHRHISMLLTIPGFFTAQRFHCAEAARQPFLALYRLAGPEVMTGEAYTSKAGRMSVDPAFRVNMTDWDRNLVAGDAAAIAAAGGEADGGLAVADGAALTLVDRLDEGAPPLPAGFAALEVIGLDRTVAGRGVRIGADAAPDALDGWTVRRFVPIHPVRRPGP